jgi:peptide-methionine (S)-S-oxide reductase
LDYNAQLWLLSQHSKIISKLEAPVATALTSSLIFYFCFFFQQGKNDEVLRFARTAKPVTKLAPATAPEGLELATFAGGCFWGIELAYQRVPGVTQTWVGYTQGQVEGPSYEAVCRGSTGHTEAVHMHYNPKEVPYQKLLDVFFEKTDPTTLNRQGNDAGTQYRSGVYYHNDEQKAAAEAAFAEVQAQLDAGKYPRRVSGKKVVSELKPAVEFWMAEDYHQQYLAKGGRGGRAQSAEKGCTDPIRCYG